MLQLTSYMVISKALLPKKCIQCEPNPNPRKVVALAYDTNALACSVDELLLPTSLGWPIIIHKQSPPISCLVGNNSLLLAY